MFVSKWGLAVAVLVCGLAAPNAAADEPKVKKPQPAAEPAKPIIIQIDGSKLPPDVLKELLKLSKPAEPTKPVVKPGADGVKPGTKPPVKPEPTKVVKSITLSDAIAITEKTTKGTVVKAERESEDGKVRFKLDVLDGKGGKAKVTLDASGNTIGTEKKGDSNEKGKKKKDD